ncbi:MAG: TIGR01244 family phosphatase [Robiginitomaculum sp.]|nr:MAG: TIGR01244 family phosphatase [Robiginitomaculum sp.]
MFLNLVSLLARATALAVILLVSASYSQAEQPVATPAAYDQQAAIAAGLRPLNDGFAVAPQIQISDLQAIKDAGFTRIINHRPDGEGRNQPLSAQIAAEAERLGLTFVDLPFASGRMTQEAFDGLQAELSRSDEPTLSYCRSGNRAVGIWAMAEVKAKNMTPDEVIAAASSAGYRLQSQRQNLQQLAASE